MIVPRHKLVWGCASVGALGCAVLIWASLRPTPSTAPPPPVPAPSASGSPALPTFIPQTQPQSPQEVREEMDALATWLHTNFPTDVEAIELAARLRFHLGEFDWAEALWRQALQLDPDFPFGHHGLAIVLALRGDYENSLYQYRETLRLAPRTIEPILECGDLLIKAGKISQAIDLLENDFPSSIESIWRYNMLGQCYLHEGDLDRARLMYNLALSLDPNDPTALYGLSVVCTRLGDKEQAALYADKLKQVRDKERQQQKEKRMAFEETHNLSVKLAEIYGKAAKFLLSVKRADWAGTFAKRAIQLNPQDPDARHVQAHITLTQVGGASREVTGGSSGGAPRIHSGPTP